MDVDGMGNNNSSAQLQKPQTEDLENGHEEPYGDFKTDGDELVTSSPSRADRLKINGSSGLSQSPAKSPAKSPSKQTKPEPIQDSQMSDDGATEPEPVDFEMADLNEETNGGPLKEVLAKGKCLRKTVLVKQFKVTITSYQYFENGKLAFATAPTEFQEDTEEPQQTVEIFPCSDEAFREAQLKGTRNGKPVIEEVTVDDGTIPVSTRKPVVQEASEDGSVSNEDVISRGGAKKRPSRAAVISDDEEDTPLGKKPTAARGTSKIAPAKDVKEPAKKIYVLAKFTDNDFYPALCDTSKKSTKGSSFLEVEFLDTKQFEDVPKASVFAISDLNAILEKQSDIKVLYRDSGEEYLPATFMEVVRDEGKPPVYVVKTEDGDEKRIKLPEFAMNHDEVLRLLNDLKPLADMGRSEKDGSVEGLASRNGKRDSASESGSVSKTAGNRAGARSSTRVTRMDSPSKPALEKKATTAKAAPKASTTKKSKAKTPTPDLEDEDSAPREKVEEDTSVVYRVGTNVYHKGQKVFAMWEDDKRYYAGRINGTRGSLLKIDWCENDQVNYVKPEDIILEKDILKKGTRVNVIADGKAFYDEMVFDAYVEDGNHLMTSKKGAVYPKNFSVMMIQAEEVKRWRKNQSKGDSASGSGVKSKKSTEPEVPSKAATSATTKKRGLSPSAERPASEEKSAKRSKAKAELAKESSPDNAPLLANSAFIITSGADKDSTFEREYIVKKVEELGGAVLNTFDELSSAAGKRYLVAPTACRTAKFLQCLAANIPCVSHKWILELADKGGSKKVDIEKYRLPSGKSSQTGKLVSWIPRKTLLDNMRVGLYGGNGFRSTWLPAFKAAKADPIALEDKDINETAIGKLDCVIVEDLASPKLVETCTKKNIPLVTVEWIIQTLIHGTKQSFDFWPYQDQAAGNA